MRLVVGIASSLLLATTAHAVPKKLECKNTGKMMEWAADHSSFYHRMCKEYGSHYCALAERQDEEVSLCLATGQNHSHTHYRTFDDDDLGKSKGQSWVKPCWKRETNFENVDVTSTDNTISFESETGSTFNVDRQTLKAGWGDDRELTCTLSDIDT